MIFPLASIIVPIYNVEDTLERCLDSIIHQTYENIEIILVNDGSTDNSIQICNKYKEEDSRILLISKENGGLSSARNIGLDVASGDYIFFVDSDDWISPNLCSSCIELFNEYNTDIIIFGFYSITSKRKVYKAKVNSFLSKEKAMKGLLIDGIINNYAWNKAYKATLFNEIRYPNGKTFEDIGTTYRLFDKANTFYLYSEALYNYEIRTNSISSKWWKSNKKIHDYFYTRKEQAVYIENNFYKLTKYAKATTGLAALIGITYLPVNEKYEIENYLIKNRTKLTKNNFPFSILFNLYYHIPKLSIKIIKTIFH